jgi:hypothetical protein
MGVDVTGDLKVEKYLFNPCLSVRFICFMVDALL